MHRSNKFQERKATLVYTELIRAICRIKIDEIEKAPSICESVGLWNPIEIYEKLNSIVDDKMNSVFPFELMLNMDQSNHA